MTYDVAMEVPLLYKMVEDCKKHYGDRGLLDTVYTNVLGFGHVGDGVSRNQERRGYQTNGCDSLYIIEPAHYGEHSRFRLQDPKGYG